MKRIIVGIFLSLALLTGCSHETKPEPAPTQNVTVGDIAPKPDAVLMESAPAKQYMVHDMTNSQASGVVKYNNLRAQTVEYQRDQLQQYVCTLFKPASAGPVCNQ